MRIYWSKILRKIPILVIGVLIGFFLLNPIFLAPPALVVAYIKQFLLFGSGYLHTEEAIDVLQMATMYFFTSLPNTLLLSAITLLILRKTACRRLLLYSTLCWPVFLHLAHWFVMWGLKDGAARVNSPFSPEYSSFAIRFGYMSVHMVATYAVFFLA